MDHLTLVGDRRETAARMSEELGSRAAIDFQDLGEALDVSPGDSTLLDIDLSDDSLIPQIKEWLAKRPGRAKVVCAVDRSSHLQHARACALGVTAILNRPIHAPELISVLWGDDRSPPDAAHALQSGPIAAADGAFDRVFSSATRGEQVDLVQVSEGAEALIAAVESEGLANWIAAVRAHHSATYQHCLLVTGLAIGFGQAIGASRADQQRLSRAALLHDLGKAQIPLSILEKNGPLDEREQLVMRTHPEQGLAALRTIAGLPGEILDIVVHHHEYLDGSGYPHGLTKSEISDLVRMITIVDVFGALIERRSYKAPMPAADAYEVLRTMGDKLDQDLVRAFQSVASHAR